MTAHIPIRCTMVSVLAVRGRADATRVLAVQRASAYLKDAWSYIAGHVEAGEAGWQTALRELYEETALVPAELYATSFCERFYSGRDDCIEVVPAFVARVGDDAEVRLNPEHSTFRWVSLADAAAMFPFGSQRDLLAHVHREFIERQPSPWLRIEPERR
ncbi:MAG: NUDIX hydrolase [Rhodanobacteraceae bacterium]